MSYFLSPMVRYEETYEPEHTYTFIGPCVKTGKEVRVTVPATGLYRFHQGAFMQDAFPDLAAADREWLISGYSAEGWALIFDSDEEEEEDDCAEGMDS